MPSAVSEPSRRRSSRASGLRSPPEGTSRARPEGRAIPHGARADGGLRVGPVSGGAVAGEERQDARAAVDRARVDWLAAAADPVRLVGSRARVGALHGLVRAAR